MVMSRQSATGEVERNRVCQQLIEETTEARGRAAFDPIILHHLFVIIETECDVRGR